MPLLRRRNFLPTVIISILLWASLGIIVFFLNPDNKFQISNFKFQIYPNIVLFFITLTLSLTLTLALLFGNTRRGFLVSLTIVGLLILKILCFRS